MGGCGSPFICLSLCLSVGPARGWDGGGGVGDGGWEDGGEGWEMGGTQHSEGGRGGGRWKSEQNNLAQSELRCGGASGVEGGAGERVGITVVKETVICPRPGPSFPIGKNLSNVVAVFSRDKRRAYRVSQVIGNFWGEIKARKWIWRWGWAEPGLSNHCH